MRAPTDTARVTALLALLGYLALARAAGNLYPFSSFNMYSTERLASASRVVARDEHGAVHELDEYSGWDCPAPPDLAPHSCPAQWPFYYIPYLDREAADLLRDRAASLPDAPMVTLIRRVWRLGDRPGAPPIEDCVLRTCRAVPR
jgi:hypothetical protein